MWCSSPECSTLFRTKPSRLYRYVNRKVGGATRSAVAVPIGFHYSIFTLILYMCVRNNLLCTSLCVAQEFADLFRKLGRLDSLISEYAKSRPAQVSN